MNQLHDSGIDVIGSVPWGTHFCQFYSTRDDLIDILVPFFKAGLENNEFCMWVTSEPLKKVAARNALRKAIPDYDRYEQKGQIEIIPHDRWYLIDGVFDANRVFDGWIAKLKKAQAAGYSGMRVSGNTFWLEKKHWGTFTDYEAMINDIIGRYEMLALCTYCLDKCNGAAVIDVVKNHQFALTKHHGKWDIIESSNFHKVKEALHHSEEQLHRQQVEMQTLFDNIPAGLVLFDAVSPFRVLIHNRYYQELFAEPFRSRGMTGLNITQYAPDVEASGIMAVFDEAVRTGKPRSMLDFSYNAHPPQESWFNWYLAPVIIEDRVVALVSLSLDVTGLHIADLNRKKAEAQLNRLNRELKAISECNQIIVRAVNETELLNEICRIMCEVVGYKMGWIGIVENDESRIVRPAAWFGLNSGYLDTAGITWADSERGRGPTGVAARTGMTDFCQDFSADLRMVPWREAALLRDFRSSIAIPLTDIDKNVTAVFTLYSDQPGIFTPDEVRLLEELATDVSYGLRVIRGRKERNLSVERLRETRDYLDNLINYANAPIIVWNSDFEITRFNHAFEHLTGRAEDEVLNNKLDILFPPDSRAKSMKYIRQTLTGQRWETVEIPIIHKDGTVRILLWNSATIYTPDGKTPLATIAQGQDITERKQGEQIKDEFIGMVSHELKTPLTVITGALNVARTENIPPEEKETLLDDVAWGAETMADIVDNLLELSRWQSHRLVLASEPLDIGPVIRRIIGNSIEKSPQHKVVAVIAPRLPLVNADSLRLQRILENLVNNAVKYSPNGGVVKVSARQDKDCILIGVHDEGIGIKPEDIVRLFQPFTRLENLVSGSAIQGIGLGLVVCKHLVEAHGGRIWVESAPGKGSTFFFTLPASS
jgi:PAS domain S-box-containing protein